MNTKKVRMIIVLTIVLVLLIKSYKRIYQRLFFGPDCALEFDAKNIEIHGIIRKKYIDSNNHSYPTILVFDGNDLNRFYFTDVEDTLLWGKIEVQDSINKNQNSLTYLLKKQNKTDTIYLKYNCRR